MRPCTLTAWHEAGHAVAALAQGGKIISVTMSGESGLCRYSREIESCDDALVRAGALAVTMAVAPLRTFEGAEQDLKFLLAECAERRVGLAVMLGDATRLLAPFSKAVRGIAEALDERQELSGSEAQEIFDSSEVHPGHLASVLGKTGQWGHVTERLAEAAELAGCQAWLACQSTADHARFMAVPNNSSVVHLAQFLSNERRRQSGQSALDMRARLERELAELAATA